MVGLVLLRLFREAATAEAGPEQRRAVLEIARELSRLRRGDHQQKRVNLLVERWEEENYEKEKAAMAEEDRKLERVKAQVRITAEDQRREYLAGMADQTLSPRRKASLEELFQKYAEGLSEVGAPTLPDEEEIQEERQRQQARRKGARKAKSTDGSEPADPE
jgi:hypothetical protein